MKFIFNNKIDIERIAKNYLEKNAFKALILPYKIFTFI